MVRVANGCSEKLFPLVPCLQFRNDDVGTSGVCPMISANWARRSWLFGFAVKLGNSASVFPQFDIRTARHLLSAFLRRVVVDALEVDSFDMMPVRFDQIRAIV
jgi:hypothetical protein